MATQAGGWHHHGLGPFELGDEAREQRQRLGLIAGVPVHLAAAGLASRKVHRVAEPFQHAHYCLAGVREQRVVIASNKKRNSQAKTSVA